MKVGKRLFQYAWKFKRGFILAILMLGITVAAELTGPFIAKTMIDTHILGIEKKWYQLPSNDTDNSKAVSFRGKMYVREDNITPNEVRGSEAAVLQVGRQFVLVDSVVERSGVRKLDSSDQAGNGTLTVTNANGGDSVQYPAQILTSSELYEFYRPQVTGVITLMSLYIGMLLFASFFQYGQQYLMQISANRVIQKMRVDVYQQVHRMPVNYFDNLPAGKVVSRVTNDTEAIKDLFVSVLTNFVSGFITILGVFVALFLLDVRLALACLVILPILYLWITGYRKLATKYNEIIRSRLSDMNGMLNESIQGMPIIRAFRRQKETKREFESYNQDYFKYKSKMLKLDSFTSHNLVGFIRNASFTFIIWYFGGASLGGGAVLSVGVIYAFVDYLNRLFSPITGIVNQLAQLEQARVSAQRVFELIDEPGQDVDEGTLPRYKGNVKFENIWFAYKEDDYVLKDISLEAKQGQTVALVGHTGSGKSSIMNVLFRFYDATKGKITVDGTDITSIPKQQIRQHMGIVLQDPFLFTGTIANNVSLNDPSISREKVEKALRDVGADKVLGNLPQGFDEPVLEKGSTLSAGQRQLISFARALAFDPAILILDEATASIDTETEAVIQEALNVVKKGRTTFIIAHRLSTIRSADQILVLHRGQIVERGTHESLMAERGRYYGMYQLQQGQSVQVDGNEKMKPPYLVDNPIGSTV
jgi:ATP-binding cassette, subfamily B, multidrug efflux pump